MSVVSIHQFLVVTWPNHRESDTNLSHLKTDPSFDTPRSFVYLQFGGIRSSSSDYNSLRRDTRGGKRGSRMGWNGGKRVLDVREGAERDGGKGVR